MGLTPVFDSNDGFFNAAAARDAYELVQAMEPAEAEVFTTMVVAETLWDTIEKNQRTLQRHLDQVIAKQAEAAMEVLSKRADGAAVIEEIVKALNPYDYGYKFDENDFNRDRKTGRFKTKVNYTATKPLKDKTASSFGIPTPKTHSTLRGVPKERLAEYQQGYMQVANFLNAFQNNGLAGDTDFLYTVENPNTGETYTVRRKDTTRPTINPRTERITEIEARPAGLTAAGASFGLVSALGGSDRSTWVAADKMNRFQDDQKGFNPFGQAWLDASGEVSSSNDRLYGRVKSGSDFLAHMSHGNPKLEMAAQFGRLVGQHGPQAEKVIGPRARTTMYRYRGTEKTPDSDLTREYEKAIRSPQNVDGSESGTRAQRLATAYMARKVPKGDLYDLNLKAGHTPPSEGIIIDKNGKLVTQAIGYGDDHYLPFNLRNLGALKGGEYIRTRSVGGPTSEDIYTGLMTGADKLTVVSRSGIFVVKFDDTFRGTRRYNDKAGRMIDRYEKLVDAVKSENVTRQPLEPSVRQSIRDEVNRTMDFASPKERQRAIARKEEEYRMYPRITAEDEKLIESRVGNLEQQDPIAANKMRQQFRNDILEQKSYNYKLNGDGYAAALKALQEQFPYYIADVRHVTLNENAPFAIETDRGYVKPRHNRPEQALEGYYDAQILGTPKSAAVENSGKFKASEADYQNWKRNSQNPNGRFVPVRREEITTESGNGVETPAQTTSTGSTKADALATQLKNQAKSDNFAEKAWDLRNFLVQAKAAPKDGERGAALFQLEENEFKDKVKEHSEDLEHALAPYRKTFMEDEQFAPYRKVIQAYYDAKGVAGGVPFDPAKHLGAKPVQPYSFREDAYAEGASIEKKVAELNNLAQRTKITQNPLNRIKDDGVFKSEIERLQKMRNLAKTIHEYGSSADDLAKLRASGQLGDWKGDELAVMVNQPQELDQAIENTQRAWTLTKHIMDDTSGLERALSTPSGERGELPKVVKPSGSTIVVPPSNVKDKRKAAQMYEDAGEEVGQKAEEVLHSDPATYTQLEELANDLYTSRERPDHIESQAAWRRYQMWKDGKGGWQKRLQ